MKTFHIEAEEGQIAKTVLMPGDPMRAKYIAEHYLTDVICYSQVRGMNGYTGYYNGKKVSVQGSGMGIPSMGIYSYELFNTFGVFAPLADYGLLESAVNQARILEAPFYVGNVYSSDVFYEDLAGEKGQWEKMGVLAQEMETMSLYCTAARAGKKALTMLTVGSSIHSSKALTNEEREKNLDTMIRCALEVA